MTSKWKSLLFFENAKKMMCRFAAFLLMSASHIWQFQLSFFFYILFIFAIPKGEHVSLSDKGGILALHKEGKTYRAIAKQFGSSVEEHHTSVPQNLVWVDSVSNEGGSWCQRGTHQLLSDFCLYFTILTNKSTYLKSVYILFSKIVHFEWYNYMIIMGDACSLNGKNSIGQETSLRGIDSLIYLTCVTSITA